MEEVSLGLFVALQSTGVVELSFDPRKPAHDSLSVVAVNTDAGFMPGWLTPYGDKIYCVSRTSPPGSESMSGRVSAFQHAPAAASGKSGTGLALFDQASSNGEGGVHCKVSPDGKILAAVNITASTLSIYPLANNGAMGKPTILDYNQSDPGPKQAHPHQAAFDPSGQFFIVPLRTMDRIDVYSIKTAEQITKVHSITLPDLAGPRHVAFNPVSPSKVYMYLSSENDNFLRVYTLNYTGLQDLTCEFKQALSTMGTDLPPTADEHKNLACEVAVSNDGKFVYVSNRNLTRPDDDTMAIYSIDSDPAHDEHHLTYLGCQRIPGKHPRMFALSKDEENRWVAVANQFSQDIVVFERDPTTGFLKDVRGRISVKVAAPQQLTPEKVSFLEDMNSEDEVGWKEMLKGRVEGPMCVLWK